MELHSLLNKNIEKIITSSVKAAITSPREVLFLASFFRYAKKAERRRARFLAEGEPIPPFLIASITGNCNFNCQGCYHKAQESLNEKKADSELYQELSTEAWTNIFHQARECGVSFILLAGGEPLLRRDVLEQAASIPEIIFPVFTNGVLLSDTYLQLFGKRRNLFPVISLEGDEAWTDQRRGAGVYESLTNIMRNLKGQKIFYGISVTVTKENLMRVSDPDFVDILNRLGCLAVFYVEYVPIMETRGMTPMEKNSALLENRIKVVRDAFPEMLFISFPGDEDQFGGCLAAGRGFFHINQYGSAEPCPFSPYADRNLKNISLREAINSPLFQKIRNTPVLSASHTGGCVLFEQKDLVESLLTDEDEFDLIERKSDTVYNEQASL